MEVREAQVTLNANKRALTKIIVGGDVDTFTTRLGT